MKIIRNLNKKHNAPPGGTGKGHAADSQGRCKKPCENDPQTGLNKGSQKGHFHHAHAPVKAVGPMEPKRIKEIEEMTVGVKAGKI